MMLENASLSYRQACELLGMPKKDLLKERNFQSKLASLLLSLMHPQRNVEDHPYKVQLQAHQKRKKLSRDQRSEVMVFPIFH